jgi:hypothetical protein
MSLITTYPWARPKVWNTGSAAERFRHNRRLILKNKKKRKLQAASRKLQAASLKRNTIK